MPALQAFGGRVDVTVELAVCRLLLGDPIAAEAALRMAPDSTGSPDEGIAKFVLVRIRNFFLDSAAAAHHHHRGRWIKGCLRHWSCNQSQRLPPAPESSRSSRR